VGANGPNAVNVAAIDYTGIINQMGFTENPLSDHLPIVVSW
jgi:hypothetical protein